MRIPSLSSLLTLFKICLQVWLKNLKGTLKAFEQATKEYEVMFFDMLKYGFSESVFNTLYIEIKYKFKKISFEQNKWYKIAVFFLLRAPIHRSFTLNLRFLNELKHKVRFSNTVCGILYFQFRFAFIKV